MGENHSLRKLEKEVERIKKLEKVVERIKKLEKIIERIKRLKARVHKIERILEEKENVIIRHLAKSNATQVKYYLDLKKI